jgi:hypothetical protein
MYRDDYESMELCGHNRNHDSGIRHRCIVVVKMNILRNTMGVNMIQHRLGVNFRV